MKRHIEYRMIYDDKFGFEPYRKDKCWFYERHVILTSGGLPKMLNGWLLFEVKDFCCSVHQLHSNQVGILNVNQDKIDSNFHLFMILCREDCPKDLAEWYSSEALAEFFFKSPVGERLFSKYIQEMNQLCGKERINA